MFSYKFVCSFLLWSLKYCLFIRLSKCKSKDYSNYENDWYECANGFYAALSIYLFLVAL